MQVLCDVVAWPLKGSRTQKSRSPVHCAPARQRFAVSERLSVVSVFTGCRPLRRDLSPDLALVEEPPHLCDLQSGPLPAVLRAGCAGATHGKGDYIGEDVSQLEHALQAADLAHRSGLGLEATLAALLHDVGHLLGMEDKSHARMGDCGVANHENLGGGWLAGLGFSPKVCQLVSRHVDAKRYLCAVNKEYHDTLSSASKTTLIHQGGPMTQQEAKAFEEEELFKVILAMRRWDEAAKVKGKKVPELEAYRDMMEQNVGQRVGPGE
eukprot:s6833_g2.t1